MSSESFSEEHLNFPISILQRPTRVTLSTLLNPKKLIATKENILRDWRGLAQLLGYDDHISYFASTMDATDAILQKWSSETDSKVSRLLFCLQKMDRFDVIKDLFDMLFNDIICHINPTELNESNMQLFLTHEDYENYRNGKPLVQYTASVVYAPEDLNFAIEIVQKLEYDGDLNVFVPERAVLNTYNDTTLRILSARCNKIIVVLSPDFLKSPLLTHFMSFMQSSDIEERVKKIIPCVYKECDIPQELKHVTRVHYDRSMFLFNFFEKLKESVLKPSSEIDILLNESSFAEIQSRRHDNEERSRKKFFQKKLRDLKMRLFK